jgi:glycosyltransferase involved in cell wall biosynthesis
LADAGSRAAAHRGGGGQRARLHGPYFLTGEVLNDGALAPWERERVRREGLAIARAGAVSAPSRFVLSAVRKRFEADLRDAVVIPNPTGITPLGAGWKAERANPDEILFVGRFDRIKGADIALRAFAHLAKSRPNLRLTFAGPCDTAMVTEGRRLSKEAFLAEAMEPEIAARVNFLGKAPHQDLAALRDRAFVTIVSSRIEMFPNVMLESMARGSPTAAARVGGIPEIAQDGEEALLVTPDDPADLARAVAALLDDPRRAAGLGAAGRRRIERDFAAPQIARSTLEFYQEVAARRASMQRRRGRSAS